MRAGVVVISIACACNQVYGIDETSGPDSDSDGVGDGADNCVLVANSAQQDADGDRVGDACDPCVDGPQLAIDEDRDGVDDGCDVCLTGPNSDEDSDGHLDGCDICPARSGGQEDADSDGVGDACDHAPSVANARVMFDGFAPPRAGWTSGFQPWAATGGGMRPVPPIDGNFSGAWHPDSRLSQVGWAIEVGVRIPPPEATSSTTVALNVLTADGGHSGRQCGLAIGQGTWRVLRTAAVIQVGDVVRLQLRERTGASECWIDGVLVETIPNMGSLDIWWPVLDSTDEAAEFQWVDVIR